MEWHVSIQGRQSGPHPEHHVAAWARSGQLAPGDPVWSEGMPAWLPAGQVQPFASVYAGATNGMQPAAALGDDPFVRALLPVGRSGWAIAAGYLGLISVLLLPAPLAVITGILALIDIKKHPQRHGIGRAVFGIAMGAVFSIILVLVLLLSALE